MRMIEDLAHDAFRAARAGDVSRIRSCVAEVAAGSPAVLDTAVQLWMDRLLVVLGDPFEGDGRLNLKVEMLPDDSGTGRAVPLGELRDEISWVGRMFVAYTMRDMNAWRQLWATVPAGRVTAYMEMLLNTMAKTTLAYEEANSQTPPADRCCAIHGWILDDPAATGDLLAKAHLN